MSEIKTKAIVFLITILITTMSIFAKTDNEGQKYRIIESNLIVGLDNDNIGLKISCAYFLGEMQSTKATNKLLKMLKSGDTEEERIIAALSLSKIKSAKALFAVKQNIKFDVSKRAQRICELFYNSTISSDQNIKVIVEPIRVVDLNMEYNNMKLAQFLN